MKAIIGGTGIYNISKNIKKRSIETEYGNVEVEIIEYKGEEIVFLPRHGSNHSLPPHLINYRANGLALKNLGVTHIYSICAVGSLRKNYAPGDLVLMNDFLDFTKSRPTTIHDGKNGVKHVDMSDPYCRDLRERFKKTSKEMDIDVKGEAVYVCTEGPRFESASEIKFYGMIGGDVVGMTNVPELVIAKELGMCYSAVGIITNWCTGFNSDGIVIHDIHMSMKKNKEKITNAFMEILSGDLTQDNCNCNNSLLEL